MASVANNHSPMADSSPSDASTPASKAATTTKRKRSTKTSSTINNAASAAAAAASASKPTGSQRELLTPSQKQSNHRNAEVRRRQEITERLTMICDEIVPGAKGLAKSTEAAYTKSHEYLRDMLLEKQGLIDQIQAMGGTVPQEELDAVARLEAYYAIEDGEESDETADSDGDDGGEDGDDGDHDFEGIVVVDGGGAGAGVGGREDAVNAAESLNAMKVAR